MHCCITSWCTMWDRTHFDTLHPSTSQLHFYHHFCRNHVPLYQKSIDLVDTPFCTAFHTNYRQSPSSPPWTILVTACYKYKYQQENTFPSPLLNAPSHSCF
uniref:Uncharacterized protein n=1 Tax=Arundo donax TaxID=35708 RepID=A0A0A9E9R2_ARUDO